MFIDVETLELTEDLAEAIDTSWHVEDVLGETCGECEKVIDYESVVVIKPTCHPEVRFQVLYHKGMLSLVCIACREEIRFAVARRGVGEIEMEELVNGE